MVNEWKFIDSAPRDGSYIILASLNKNNEVEESYEMRWDKDFENGLFPDVKGFWVNESNTLTWCDVIIEFGPTHWKEIKE